MSTGRWKNKIEIMQQFESGNSLLSDNSMGIYFDFESDSKLIIHFKPLNETFKTEALKNGSGTLIRFERDLIDEDEIEYALDVMALFNRFPQFKLSKKSEVQQLQTLIQLLKEEFNNDSASFLILKSLLKVLLLHLIRYQEIDFSTQDLNQKRVFQFLELMEKNFLTETNSHFYAREIGISLKRLNQILKEKLNLTARQVIQQRQITEAKRQLVKSKISTKELAYELGFSSISSFSRFFKKNVGVTPSVYKTINNPD